MRTRFVTIAIMLVRLAGVLALGLGIALWLGHYGPVLHAHMGLGTLMALALAALAVGALRVVPAWAVLGLLWSALLVGLGVAQTRLLPGELHWLVQVAHLVVGLGGMAQAERLAARLRRG